MASPEELQLAVTAVSLNTQTAEQAALVNQAYMSNNLPVLSPVAVSPATQDYGQLSQYQREQVYKGGTQNNLILTWNTQGLSDPANQQGKAVYLTPTEYQQQYGATDAQREQVRYNIFNNPAAVNPNTIPADMQGIYETQKRDQISDYYRANPSAEFQRITQQYEANRYGSVGSGSNYTYNYGSSKNPFDPNSAAGIAWDVNRLGGTVGMTLGGKSYSEGYNAVVTDAPDRSVVPTRLVGSGMVAGMSAGSQFVDDVDIYMAVGGYQGVRVPDAKLAIDYQTGEFGVYQKMGTHNIYGLVGGGGWNSLQSGMFSFGESLWDKEHTFAQSDIGSMAPVSSEYMSTHSKAGAEAYGGFSRLLTGNLLQSDDAVSRYGNWNNLANYVQPVAATKGAVKGADIPWTMDINAPAAQYMDWGGLTGQTFDVSMPDNGRLVGSKMVASQAVIEGVSGSGIEGLPKPYISDTTGTVAPTGEITLLSKGSVFGFDIPEISFIPPGILGGVSKFFQPESQVTTRYNTTTNPMVPTGTTISGGSAEWNDINAGIEADRQNVDVYNKTAVDAFNARVGYANNLSASNPIITTTTYKGGSNTVGTSVSSPIAGSSGWDKAMQGIRDTLHLPSPEAGEQAVKIGSLFNPFVGPAYVGGSIVAKGSEIIFGKGSDIAARSSENAEVIYTTSLGPAGQYTGFYEQPVLMPVSYGIGAGFGVAAGIVEKAYMGSRAAAAGKIISTGGGAGFALRTVEQVGGTAMRWAPTVLTGLYSVDVAGRSTGGFSDFNPVTVFPKGRAIGVQEAGMMAFGFEAPSQAATAIKSAGIEYQSIKQTIAAERNLAYSGVELGAEKGGVVSFEQVSRAPVKPSDVSFEDVVRYRYEQPIRETIGSVTGKIGEIPGAFESGVKGARLKWMDTVDTATSLRGAPAPELSRPYYSEPSAYPGTEGVPVRGFRDIVGDFTFKLQVSANARVPSEIPRPIYQEPTSYPGAPTKSAADSALQYMKVKGTDMFDFLGVAMKRSARAGITPESGPAHFPEFATTGVYSTPAAESGRTGSEIFQKTLSRFIQPSTFGETKVPRYITSQPGTVGGASGTTTSRGGSGGTGGYTKSLTVDARAPNLRKTPYGTGLAKEPSLKSMGMSEVPSGEPGAIQKTIGRTTDFRGSAPAKMKPMDFKVQSGGQGVLTEQLPIPEGMNTGQIRPQETRFFGAPSLSGIQTEQIRSNEVMQPATASTRMFSPNIAGLQQQQRHGVVQVVEPSLGFSQDSKTRQGVMLGFDQVVRPVQGTRQDQYQMRTPFSEVATVARQSQFVSVAPAYSTRWGSETASTSRRVTDVIRTPSQDNTVRQSIRLDTRLDTKVGQEQKQTPGQMQITRPHTPFNEPIIPKIPGGLPWGGAGGESPFSRKRKAAFVETFNMGLDMGFLGRKGRASKSFTTPAKYKRKPAAVKPAKKAAPKKRK